VEVIVWLTYQRQRIAQQDEPRRVVWQVFGELVERLVHCLVFILTDFLGLLIDHIDDGLWVASPRCP
jgi:hypothetical protein